MYLTFSSILRAVTLLFASLALAVSMGCSFSASSESSSDILSSPFKSSSKSSGGDVESAYREEAAGYTSAYAAAGMGDKASFQRGLSEIAARQGISDWEANPGTWTSVGRGLASADIDEEQVVDYADTWSAGDPDIVSMVLQGYTSVR